MLQIKGFQGITLLDYPERVSATIFVAGCNFRCPFCHNYELVENFDQIPTIEKEKLFTLIEERKNFIEGLAITGGEPLLSDDISDLLIKLKNRFNLPIKVDTNGYNPDLLKRLLDENLVDYIAMDIKTSPSKYSIGAGINLNFKLIEKSVNTLLDSKIDYEFRTTMVPEIVNLEDIREIGILVEGAKKYVLQQFRNIKTLNNDFTKIIPYKPEELKKARDILVQFVQKVILIGV